MASCHGYFEWHVDDFVFWVIIVKYHLKNMEISSALSDLSEGRVRSSRSQRRASWGRAPWSSLQGRGCKWMLWPKAFWFWLVRATLFDILAVEVIQIQISACEGTWIWDWAGWRGFVGESRLERLVRMRWKVGSLVLDLRSALQPSQQLWSYWGENLITYSFGTTHSHLCKMTNICWSHRRDIEGQLWASNSMMLLLWYHALTVCRIERDSETFPTAASHLRIKNYILKMREVHYIQCNSMWLVESGPINPGLHSI